MSESKMNRFFRKRIERILYPCKRVLPRWKEIDAKSPQFADIGERLNEMNWKGTYIPVWGYEFLLGWMQHERLADKAIITEKNNEIKLLKSKIKELEDKIMGEA